MFSVGSIDVDLNFIYTFNRPETELIARIVTDDKTSDKIKLMLIYRRGLVFNINYTQSELRKV